MLLLGKWLSDYMSNHVFCCSVRFVDEMEADRLPYISKTKGDVWIQARQVIYCPRLESYLINNESKRTTAFPMRCPENPEDYGLGLDGWEFDHTKSCRWENHSMWVDILELAYCELSSRPKTLDEYTKDLQFLCITGEIRKYLKNPREFPPGPSFQRALTEQNDVVKELPRRELGSLIFEMHPNPFFGQFAMKAAAELAIEKGIDLGFPPC